MLNIDDLNKKVNLLISELDDEEVLEEVQTRYVPFKKNLDLLLDTKTTDEYFELFQNIDEEQKLECFNLNTTDDIKNYLNENEIDLDKLKKETLVATYEALEFIIYDSEEEEY
ncbi:MAG: hypothetical protein U9N02_02365 [Campylobacterota bacterium]|nr:hypothetical protein [Campylobacterota bacterium]